MKVYRISKCQYIDDLSGTGAFYYAGRWHNKGTHILYTAETASLALLESIVHITSITAINFCMICLEVPDMAVKEIDTSTLPKNWRDNPPPDLLKKTGDDFIKENKYLAFKLPSAIMPEENNFLLNPFHKNFKQVKIIYPRKVVIDNRLIKI